MTDIETLILNEVRRALENLSDQGVGCIYLEHTNEILYRIDDRHIKISIEKAGGR